jgi:hypothetical protein
LGWQQEDLVGHNIFRSGCNLLVCESRGW